MELRDLLAELKKLDLPADQFAVFGSGPMAPRGLREINDLDLIVTDELWAKLALQYEAVDHEHGLRRIQVGNIEILDGWYPSVGAVTELIRHADVVDSVRFVRLEKVLEWKRAYARPKDAADIELIEAWMSRNARGSDDESTSR